MLNFLKLKRLYLAESLPPPAANIIFALLLLQVDGSYLRRQPCFSISVFVPTSLRLHSLALPLKTTSSLFRYSCQFGQEPRSKDRLHRVAHQSQSILGPWKTSLYLWIITPIRLWGASAKSVATALFFRMRETPPLLPLPPLLTGQSTSRGSAHVKGKCVWSVKIARDIWSSATVFLLRSGRKSHPE